MNNETHNSRLDTLRGKYDRYIRSGNHVKALQVMQEIGRLSALRETEQQVAVRDLYGSLTIEEKQKATDLCTVTMLFADLLQGAAVDLQEIIHRADPSARLLLMEDVKQIARLSNNIVRNVDAFHDDEFSASFGDLADLVSLNVKNIIYAERAKEKRKM